MASPIKRSIVTLKLEMHLTLLCMYRRQLRARRALMLFKDDRCSVVDQKGAIAVQSLWR